MKNYCIREDYVSREQAETYVDDPADYWNESRIAVSGFYQYPVYQRAAELAAGMDQCAFVDIGCGYPRKARELILPVTRDITLIDQPSMQGVVEEKFPEMKFVPLDLQAGSQGLQSRFDLVVCADVVEHLLDPDPLLQLIRELLAPGGLAVISTPEREMQRGKGCLSSPIAEHVREWNAAEFARYLTGSGFEIAEHDCIPIGRLSGLEQTLLPLLQRLSSRRYLGCQRVVCRPV